MLFVDLVNQDFWNKNTTTKNSYCLTIVLFVWLKEEIDLEIVWLKEKYDLEKESEIYL